MMVVEMAEALRPLYKPGAGFLVYDVAWRPGGIDGRFYDYKAISLLTDFVVIMDYDTRSQVFNVTTCTAYANSPIETTKVGIREYLELFDMSSRLVLGVPWYGYRYPCINEYSGPGTVCQIPLTIPPWRGCNCSDAAGSQWPFNDMMKVIRNETDPSTGGYAISPLNNNVTGSYATYDFKIEGGQYKWYQAWFDTPETTGSKYQVAREHNLRGISMWNVDLLSDATTGKAAADTKAMWDAMDAFLN